MAPSAPVRQLRRLHRLPCMAGGDYNADGKYDIAVPGNFAFMAANGIAGFLSGKGDGAHPQTVVRRSSALRQSFGNQQRGLSMATAKPICAADDV